MPVPDLDRFRPFAERYVIERAASFRKGFEKEDGWEAIQTARSLYKMIEGVGHNMGAAVVDARIKAAIQSSSAQQAQQTQQAQQAQQAHQWQQTANREYYKAQLAGKCP